jgi:hypothetical protein
VLAEFLTALGSSGQKLREQAGKMVRAIIANPNVKVIPQSRDSFLRGLDLFESRGDKSYSGCSPALFEINFAFREVSSFFGFNM